jgi:hypothetical protein
MIDITPRTSAPVDGIECCKFEIPKIAAYSPADRLTCPNCAREFVFRNERWVKVSTY